MRRICCRKAARYSLLNKAAAIFGAAWMRRLSTFNLHYLIIDEKVEADAQINHKAGYNQNAKHRFAFIASR